MEITTKILRNITSNSHIRRHWNTLLEMPLLGRYRSHSGSSSPSNSTSGGGSGTNRSSGRSSPVNQSAIGNSTISSPTMTTTTSTPSNQQQQPQLCESPLFGIRRQLDIGQQHDKDSGSIPQQITSQQIHYAFSIMDTNSDGLIDLRDLSQMLSNLGVPIDEAILSHVMSTVSKRGE